MSAWRRAQMALLWTAARTLGQRSTLLGGWLASMLWFTPWPTATTAASAARESEWLAGTTPLSVEAGRWRLHGYSAGHGPTVLLVHGWGDHAGRMGGFVAPLVAAGYRVVGLDLPGHGGRSPKATDLPTLAAALTAAGGQLGPIHAIVAHSMGGTVAMLATRDGLSPQALVLLAPPVRLEHAVDRFGELLDLPDRVVLGLRRRIERRFGRNVWAEYAADSLRLEVPTLVIHDVEDPQVDIGDSRLLVRAWPRAQLVETAGLAHHRIARDHDVIAAAVAFVGDTALATRTSLASRSGGDREHVLQHRGNTA